MIYFEKVKAMLDKFEWNDLKTFSKIKKKIKKLNKEIRIENVDMSELVNKDKLNQYLLSLSKKFPTCNFSFIDCIIDGININTISNQTISFSDCCITNLKIKSNDKNIINFNNCNFLFLDTEDKQISVKSNKINLNGCVVDLKTNVPNKFELGTDIESVINIKDQTFKNYNNIPFNIYINANNLTLSNYNSVENIKLVINKGNKATNYLHLVDSNVIFNEKTEVDVNMILVDNSNVFDLTTQSESIELSGNCNFSNVRILNSNDMLINEDSSLTTRNINLNVKYLTCSENSEINDTNNRFKWLTNIDRIIVNKNFKLKYNDEVMYKKEDTYGNNNDEEVIEYVENKIRSKR